MLRAMIRSLMQWASHVPAPAGGDPYSNSYESSPRAWRVSPVKAINGRVLEVAVYHHNPHGCDWKCRR